MIGRHEKTGTTNDEKDGWFIGFTPDLVVGVYMGFDNPSPMGHGETGGNLCSRGPRFLQDRPCRPAANSVPRSAWYQDGERELKTGLPAAPGDPKAIMEAFKPTQEPLGAVATDDSGSQEGLAPEEYTRLARRRLSLEASGRGRRSAATGVHGVPKAPGRLAVQGDNHGGTNNTTVARTWARACAWNVGAHIRRVLS